MKTALITGVSRGIGAAVADMLIADDWSVIGLSRTAPPPKQGLYWFRCDVGVLWTIPEILASTGIDVLDAVVHCAGSQRPIGPVYDRETPPEDVGDRVADWADAVSEQIGGAFAVVRHALPYLERAPDGRILLFSGGGAFNARPNYSAYAVAKAGIVSLMETLAVELASTTIAVNCVSPGFVPTAIHAPTVEAGPGRAGPVEWERAFGSDADAMGNVVACVRHLLSPQTRGLSGRTVSAVYDDWASLNPLTVPLVMASPAGTRTRHLISRLASTPKYPGAVLPCPVGAIG